MCKGDKMLKKFVPSYLVDHFSEVKIDKLIDLNKKLVLCDIDNTLVAHDDPSANDDVKNFIKNLKDNGIDIILISNNTESRVVTFNEDLNLDVYPMALKPSSKAYKQIFSKYKHISPDEMISLGDQVMTDVLGSNFNNIDVILTKPIVEKDLIFTKLNRMFENMVIKRMKKKGLWPNEKM